MDPLSISASIIALLQATNAVLSICYDYSCAVNGAPWGLSNLIDETRSLRNVLEALVRLVHEDKAAHLPTLRLFCQPYGPVENGIGRLEELENRLSSAGYKARVPSRRRAFFEALTWPLREAETKRTTEQIERLASTLSLAMQTDQTRLMLAIEDLAIENQNMTAETRDGIAQLQKASLSVQDDARRQKIKALLAAPDPSINHNAARSKRYPSTGEWLFKSKEYKAWRKDSFTTLWMRGPVGSGKTILTSAMIDNLVEVCKDGPSKSLAYFYFDFNDPSRRTPDAMLRSLISQLIMQRESVPAEWDSLFFANGDRQPTIEELLSILREMMQKPPEGGFLVVDALDECADPKAAGDVLDKIDRWDIEGWWLFVTSRKDAPGLGTELFFNGAVFSIPVWRVRTDIRLYIQQRLDSDPKLRRWQSHPDLKDEIRETIANKAEGMFRWAACQLDALESCLNVSMLRTTLASLPNSLDDMYAEALKLVPNEHTQLVSKLLQWLAFSTRPLYIEEIAEIATVDIASSPKFDPDRRLFDPQDIINLCPSIFVAVSNSSDGDSPDPPPQQLCLAHFSVKEYLLSDQIRTSGVCQFAMTEQTAHATIAADCLAYLLQFDRPYIELPEIVRSSPLLRYATNYWAEHVKRSGEKGYNKLEPHVLELLKSGTVYSNWTAFLEGYTPFSSDEEGPNSPPDPLYYAASYGLSRVCETLIRNGSPVDSLGQAGTALAAACLSGEADAVRVLVDNGADVNASGPLGPPLLLAAGKGVVEIVECLLQTGADVRYGSETGETALVEALRYGHKDVARLLQS